MKARRDKREHAARDFAEAHKVEPNDFRTSLLLTDTLLQLKRYEEAAAVCADALQRSPFCYMRWGGETSPEMRYWLDALQYRRLLTADPANTHERIGKAMMLAVAGGTGVYMIEDELQKSQLLEAFELLVQVAAEPELSSADRVFFCYASDRVVDALMGGGGREFYFEALKICELRETLGVFLDADFYARKALAQAGITAMYGGAKLTQLEDNAERKAEFESMNMNLLTQCEADYRKAACDTLLAGAAIGTRYGNLGNIKRAPWTALTSAENWTDIEAALGAPPVENRAESLYDELVLLVNVTEGSPAWQSGLRKFDQIVSVNGKAVNSTPDFIGTWGPIPEGEEVTIRARRYVTVDGQPQPVMENGKPRRDANGFVTWQAEDFEVKVTRGFLGVNLGQGFVPPRFGR